MTKKFLIADDHAILRKGMVNLLQNNFTGCTCTQVKNGAECIEQLKNNEFDLIILDISMPETDSFSLVEWIQTKDPESRILIYSMHPATLYSLQYYKMGAMGYINKEAEDAEILHAINLILSGRPYMSLDIQVIMSSVVTQKKSVNTFQALSEREFTIAQALSQGKSIKDISDQMSIEPSTVRTVKTKIFRKLNVRSYFEFLTVAARYLNGPNTP